MHAAAPILLSAILMLTLASLLVLGIILVRHSSPPEPAVAPPAPLPVLVTSLPLLHPRSPRLAPGLRLRAPPTLPDRSSELIPAPRARAGSAALAPSPAVPHPH